MELNARTLGNSGFFRNPEAWNKLKETVIPGANFKAWVPACSTGEEAYSLAIVFKEMNIQSQIIATDIDGNRIETAKRGLYPELIGDPRFINYAGVSPERLKRFFNKTVDGYQVKPDLRKLIEFSQHDVITDPPFTGISFISCRWLIWWLDNEEMKRLIRVFFDSLLPAGILFLENRIFYKKEKWENGLMAKILT
jgi:two-component system, chemotaxis family, CheB/CheR fusion protein